MTILMPDNCRMKDWKIDDQTANIQDGAVHVIGEHNFQWLELPMKNQNGCSSPSCKN